MNIRIRTSYMEILRIMKYKPSEIDFNLTNYLRKRIVREPIQRYCHDDYVCGRVHIDWLILHCVEQQIYLGLRISHYWLRCHDEIRMYPPPPMRVVFKIEE